MKMVILILSVFIGRLFLSHLYIRMQWRSIGDHRTGSAEKHQYIHFREFCLDNLFFLLTELPVVMEGGCVCSWNMSLGLVWFELDPAAEPGTSVQCKVQHMMYKGASADWLLEGALQPKKYIPRKEED